MICATFYESFSYNFNSSNGLGFMFLFFLKRAFDKNKSQKLCLTHETHYIINIMKKFTLISCILLGGCLSGVTAANKKQSIYKDAKAPIEDRINDLIGKMTLEEKILQMNQYTLGSNNNANNDGEEVKNLPSTVGSAIYFSEDAKLRNVAQKKAMEESRLGIPIIFGYDVIHGFRTVYPISLAQACSWNPGLVEEACTVAAQEAKMSGVDWTFSPMIDVARDGRWGRVAEGYGEDPYTNAVFCVASVKGYQGKDMSDSKRIAACLKHFIGYGASEAGRDYVYTEISNQTLWDTYIPPYEAGVKAGAATLMSSFNNISGTPGSANHYTLTEILKKRWAHDGFVVSDWGAIPQLIDQGSASSHKEAAKQAFSAGVEMDMMGHCYDKYMEELVKEGKISMAQIDDAVKRILRIKFRLGLFDNPYIKETTEKERFLLPQSLATAEQLAEETIVLLKNKGNILPLATANKPTIAVMGPMAKNRLDLLGSWFGHGQVENVSCISEALEAEFAGKANLIYSDGCDFDGEDTSKFSEALETAKKTDVILLCMGEKQNWTGENASRSIIELPAIQEQFIAEMKKVGKPIVLVLANGRPLGLSNVEPLCDAIVEMWQPGIPGGKPLAGVLSGRVNPSGKLSITFPRSTGQIPIYYNQRKSARPNSGKYQDIPSTPLYEFGYGLSYTTFNYGDIKLAKETIKRGEKLVVEIPVTNVGKRDGTEVIHWFITASFNTITRPVKELKYFEKQLIKAGDTCVFRFEIDPMRDLSFVNANGECFLENGEYYVKVKDKKIKFTLTD